jgi:DNA helicase-2/ATP-dependent DNA helicase PcrA
MTPFRLAPTREGPTLDRRQLTADTVHLLATGEVDRIFGPPGTGKTTTLAKGVCATALARGKDSMAIASFTTTSARAIADKAYEVANGNAAALVPHRDISTLHSFGYRAIRTEGVEVALEPRVLADWNATAPLEWRVTPDGRKATPDMAADTGMLGGEGDGTEAHNGDQLLSALDMARATLTPEHDWPLPLRKFSQAWEAWKTASGAVDFADMIHLALERALDGEAAPGNPQVFIVDEAQDLTPAEFALALAWGGKCDKTIFAGDDDQAINEWRGGSAAPLLAIGLDKDGNRRDDMVVVDRVLDQSFRVPSSVHAVAERWIKGVSSRHEKVYHPRDEVGTIHTSGYSMADPQMADLVRADIAAGKSVMLLATCGYHLTPVINRLRAEGIPFHNSFRPAEPRWNPLRSAGRGLSTTERLLRYLVLDERIPPRVLRDAAGNDVVFPRHRFWTGEDVRAWMTMVSTRAAQLAPGANAAIDLLPDGEVPYELLSPLWNDNAKSDEKRDAARASRQQALEPDLEWLLGVVTKTYADKLVYPAQVVRNHGIAALDTEPLVTVGTVHSVKGGGADRVYLSPDMSSAAAAQWHKGGSVRDQTRRLFYVGLTRAQESVVLLQNARGHSMTRRLLLPPELEVRPAVA